uniref:Uncharacterized protein n=1 Tax=Solanum lycopersicum TaxID=4081 RepID=A0A3Q7F0E7_SOLLC
NQEHEKDNEEQLPNSFQTAVALVISFPLGIIVPIFTAAFIANYKLSLLAYGGIGTSLSTNRMVKSCSRVLIGGRMAMVITCCLAKLIVSTTNISFYFEST